MRNLPSIAACLLTMLISGAGFYWWFRAADGAWLAKAQALQDQPVDLVKREMGNPAVEYSPQEFEARRGDIAFSYNPDPPYVSDIDRVLEYRGHLARMILFFVRDDQVVHVYSGQT